VSERELQDWIVAAARLLGWRVAHFRPAWTEKGWRTAGSYDAQGWPDLVLGQTRGMGLQGPRLATPARRGGSDLEDRLEDDRVVADWRRPDYGPVTCLLFRRSRLEDHGSLFTPANTPHGTATSYQDTDWEFLARPSNLHLSVGETEPQDRHVPGAVVVSHRRARESSSELEAAALDDSAPRERETCRAHRSERTRPLLRVLDRLDMHGVNSVLRDSALRDAVDQPERSSTAQRLADPRRRAPGDDVFVVPVRKTDHERFCRHAVVMSVFANLKLMAPALLHESLTVPPFVLLEQDATELGQRVRPRVIERPEDALAVLDRQRDHSGPTRERLLEEGACRFVDELCELADVLVGDPQTGEIHKGVGTP
jgi:hypothetical protein